MKLITQQDFEKIIGEELFSHTGEEERYAPLNVLTLQKNTISNK